VAIPLTSLSEIYWGLESALGRSVTVDDRNNAAEIYRHVVYGYHVMIDHGGGFTTLYAHCSKILVYEGQEVGAGDVIAQVGSTGRSTGNHLHFEVIIQGEKQNPRSYLP